jgi:hypothetical protein
MRVRADHGMMDLDGAVVQIVVRAAIHEIRRITDVVEINA